MNLTMMRKQQNDLQQQNFRLRRGEIELRWRYQTAPCGYQTEAAYQQDLEKLKQEETSMQQNGKWQLLSHYPKRGECFVGRQKEIDALHSALAEEKGPVFLYGMGGCGKTALACAYLERYKEEYENILFLSYDEKIRSLVENDARISITGLHYESRLYGSRLKYFRFKWELLQELLQERKSLIILDNYESLQAGKDNLLHDFLQLPCHMIVTSRIKPAGVCGLLIESFALSEAEMDAFIESYTGNKATGQLRQEMTAYAAEVDHLMLAMIMKLKKQNLEKWSDDILKSYGLKKMEMRALLYLAIMPSGGMPKKLYCAWTGVENTVQQQLMDWLLIREYRTNLGAEMLQLHPLIAAAVKKQLPPTAENCKGILPYLINHVEGSSLKLEDNGYDGKNTWSRSLADNQSETPYIFSLLQIFRNPLPWLAEGCDALVTWLWIMQYYKEAEQYSIRLYKAVEAFYGSCHQVTAQMALRTAAVYWNTGKKEISYDWYRKGYELIHKATPANEFYLHVCFKAAEKMATNVCPELGDREGTLYYMNEAIALWNRPDYPRDKVRRSPVFVMRQKCEWLLEAGQTEEAAALWQQLEEAAPDFLKKRASWQPFIGLQLKLLTTMGNQEAALKMAEKMLQDLDDYSIGKHWEMIKARELAADVFWRSGRLSEAQEQYRKCESLREQYYPDEVCFSRRKREWAEE